MGGGPSPLFHLRAWAGAAGSVQRGLSPKHPWVGAAGSVQQGLSPNHHLHAKGSRFAIEAAFAGDVPHETR